MPVNQLLIWVIAALMPCLATYVYCLGPSYLLQCGLLLLIGLGIDLLCQLLRKVYFNPQNLLASTVALLILALCLPPQLPVWMLALAAIFCIGLGRELFGGFSQNIFNPAMLSYAILLVSFPAALDAWSSEAIWSPRFDAISGATPLSVSRADRLGIDLDAGPSLPWLWFNLAALAGGLVLLFKRIIQWRIPVAVLAGLMIPSLIHAALSDSDSAPFMQLFSGATMLGAFFVATDPVSAATGHRGRLLYGALIGVMLYLIRHYGSFPDGIAFAVILGNIAAPSLDSARLWRRM